MSLWTPMEVHKLNEWQDCQWTHPFTCPNHRTEHLLRATVDGWRCPGCDYTQNWAHPFMFQGAPPMPELLREQMLRRPKKDDGGD
jgi:hypothetical protein